MKKWFAATLLALAIGYTAYGLSSLSLYTLSGRPAAGFFPLLIGLALILSCAINLWGDIREWQAERAAGVLQPHQADPAAEGTAEALGIETRALDDGREYGHDVTITFIYICGFVALLKVVGAPVAMCLFMLAFLFTFNRAHPLSNVLYSLALPGFLYMLFKILLNASLPTSSLGF